MNERTLRLASAVLAAAGAAITGYLLYARQTGGVLVCATGGCETVQSSSYAEVLGVPVAGLGLAGFLGLLLAALARGEWARMSHATLALSAFFFGAYLLYIQMVVIEAVCQWCLATDVITTAIAALALLRLRLGSRADSHAAHAPVPQASAEWQPQPHAEAASADTLTETPHAQSFDAAKSRELELGRVDLIRLGGISFDRATFEPGWRWSEHSGQSGSCPERHLGYLISGRMRFQMDDGTQLDAAAGDVYLVPPGHDAWVVGNEPCVALDLG